MKLYHVSPIKFEQIDLSKAKHFKDFGKGFYLTPSEISSINFLKKNNGYLYEFEFDINSAEHELNILNFDNKKDWFDYVYSNRTKNIEDYYDVVIGATASNCYRKFKDIRNGKDIKLSISELLENNHDIQYCFKTEKSLENLHLVSEEYLTSDDFY